jgi:hypothetical protein
MTSREWKQAVCRLQGDCTSNGRSPNQAAAAAQPSPSAALFRRQQVQPGQPPHLCALQCPHPRLHTHAQVLAQGGKPVGSNAAVTAPGGASAIAGLSWHELSWQVWQGPGEHNGVQKAATRQAGHQRGIKDFTAAAAPERVTNPMHQPALRSTQLPSRQQAAGSSEAVRQSAAAVLHLCQPNKQAAVQRCSSAAAPLTGRCGP